MNHDDVIVNLTNTVNLQQSLHDLTSEQIRKKKQELKLLEEAHDGSFRRLMSAKKQLGYAKSSRLLPEDV